MTIRTSSLHAHQNWVLFMVIKTGSPSWPVTMKTNSDGHKENQFWWSWRETSSDSHYGNHFWWSWGKPVFIRTGFHFLSSVIIAFYMSGSIMWYINARNLFLCAFTFFPNSFQNIFYYFNTIFTSKYRSTQIIRSSPDYFANLGSHFSDNKLSKLRCKINELN
jgi:hypothetical protein